MFSLNRLLLSGLILSFGFYAHAMASVRGEKCEAKTINWPKVGIVTVSICNGELLVMTRGRVLFKSSSLDRDNGSVHVKRFGTIGVDERRSTFVVRFKVVERLIMMAGENVGGNAKGVLYFDGQAWRAECDGVCSVLPYPPGESERPQMPRVTDCQVVRGRYKLYEIQGSFDEVVGVGCPKINDLYVIMNRGDVFRPFQDFEGQGALKFKGLRVVKTGNGGKELRVTVIESTIPKPSPGMGDPEPVQTRRARARVVVSTEGVSLQCAQKRCLFLPR